jgi:hypothetical protein
VVLDDAPDSVVVLLSDDVAPFTLAEFRLLESPLAPALAVPV